MAEASGQRDWSELFQHSLSFELVIAYVSPTEPTFHGEKRRARSPKIYDDLDYRTIKDTDQDQATWSFVYPDPVLPPVTLHHSLIVHGPHTKKSSTFCSSPTSAIFDPPYRYSHPTLLSKKT